MAWKFYFILLCSLAFTRQMQAQYIVPADTMSMLSPYLSKIDTASLRNRISRLAGRTLQEITDQGNITGRTITAPAVNVTDLYLVNNSTDVVSYSNFIFNNDAATIATRDIRFLINKNQSGIGWPWQASLRNNGVDVFLYTFIGFSSAFALGSAGDVSFLAGSQPRIQLKSGKLGIGIENPLYSFHMNGKAAIAGGKMMVNTVISNGYTLQVNGAAQFSDGVQLGGTLPPIDNKERLSVNGGIKTRRLIVSSQGWADYVFDSCYQLQPLSEVRAYITCHKHLPGMPSTDQVSDHGLDLAVISKQQQAGIEELTLYILGQNKRRLALEQRLDILLKQKKD